MTRLRALSKRVFSLVDQRYHRVHHLQRVGTILLIGRGTYRGQRKPFADGTVLESGDAIGLLHFDNERLSRLEARHSTSAGLGFARLMIRSLHELAELARTDPAFSRFAVYYGMTWLPPHGGSQGFMTERLTDGLRRRWLITYFRLLLWTYAAAPESRRARPDPHHYWLTRHALLSNFPAPGTGSQAGEKLRHGSQINSGHRAG